MGCSKVSTPVDADPSPRSANDAAPSSPQQRPSAPSAGRQRKKAPAATTSADHPGVRVRARTDSWALQNPPPSPKGGGGGHAGSTNHVNNNTNNNGSSSSASNTNQAAPSSNATPTVEQQWKMLWQSHSPLLSDPQDVPAVLESLMNSIVNQLSPVELTLLQRRIRTTIRSLPNPASQSKMGRVFSSSANMVEAEAKNVATQQHLLTEHVVLNKLLRAQVVVGGTNVMQNAFTIMLYLSDTLWPRVSQVAHHTAQTANLVLDVNKQTPEWNAKMPKPSQVPDLTEAPELPAGVTPQALSTLLALGRRPTHRAQRLQLLFYLCLDSAFLADFLAKHPAGGAPCWLLEVGQGQVVSLASLTHYHYYGNAFLPLMDDKKPPPAFVRSKSREPLYVHAGTVQRVLAALLAGHTEPTAENGATTTNGGVRRNSTKKLLHNGSSSEPPIREGSASNSMEDRLTVASNGITVSNGSVALPTVGLEPDTQLTRALQAETEKRSDYIDKALDTLAGRLLQNAQLSTEQWTLAQFVEWADQILTDLVLDAAFHELFGKGIFPGPSLEKRLVQFEWLEWERWTDEELAMVQTDVGKGDFISQSVKALMEVGNGSKTASRSSAFSPTVYPWGQVGGLDGGGGLGRGMMYCVDRKWWDAWCGYVGWTWVGQKPKKRKTLDRPGLLSNEKLLETDSEIVTRGTLGSYEMMKKGLKKDRDFVLVPPGVWSVLYELYSGGPPLPRMVLPPERKMSDMSARTERSTGAGAEEDLDTVMEGLARDARVSKLPDDLSVETNPWVVQCMLCDPQQPYRRGDAGHVNIRIQCMPYQPLWRLVMEAFARFPLGALNAFDEGVCKGRLWKRIEQPAANKEAVPRNNYGPWSLLSKNRYFKFPLLTDSLDWRSKVDEFLPNWHEYSDNATVESIGLQDNSMIMLEVAVMNKTGELIWPREAAAKAGRVKRLADEDKEFRNTLQGLDKDGNLLLKPPKLVGMSVDAMDGTGRWHHAKIVEVDVVDDDTEVEEEHDGDGKVSEAISRKKVKVAFKEEGHCSWIDVESDRIAKSGRFTSDTDDQSVSSMSKGSVTANAREGESKAKAVPNLVKKASSTGDNSNHGSEAAAINPYPGLGACGLTNLGNTCYQNSAIQCMGYMPLLRSYLLSSQYKTSGDLNKDNPLGTGGKLLEEIAELLRVIWSAKLGEKTPTRFRTQLGRMNSQFAGADQQDAQEFLNYALDILHEDSNRVRKKPYVEALEDNWVQRMPLDRVGEEAWRRFLRRNQSIMSDVAMGQVLNTVTCPVCTFSSRNFDPFNLLSVTIPTVADVIFQVTVFRRASFNNVNWILNRPRKDDSKQNKLRFSRKNIKPPIGPPSDSYIAEQYVIAMSRLADSSELRMQIQNVCGIQGHRLKLLRAEEFVDEDTDPESIFHDRIDMFPLTEKEGPCSNLARKKQPDEEIAAPTLILAFENTLRPRPLKKGKDDETAEDTADEDDDEIDNPGVRSFPSPYEEKKILRALENYGDSRETRFYDSDPHMLSLAVSRSMWPTNEEELKLKKGLRVDAKDNRGNWYPGSVIEIVETEVTQGNVDTGEETKVKRTKAVIHFDNFSPKWDEEYSLVDFEAGKVKPLYSLAKPKPRPTEFMVHHRLYDANADKFLQFGQSFFIQCHNEWSTARAGAQILSQATRFVRRGFEPVDMDDPDSGTQDEHLIDQLERCHLAISALIDLLIDVDRQFVRSALGFDTKNADVEKTAFRNHGYDPSGLIKYLDNKLKPLLDKLPFEIVVATHDMPPSNTKTTKFVDEKLFPLSLLRTMSNFMHVRQAIVLRWRTPQSAESNKQPVVFYKHPKLELHKPGQEVLKMATKMNKEKARRTGKSSGIDLSVCLTEFCKVQKLSLDDNWRCPRCKEFREGRQSMNLWRLPDFLTFHIKRFNMSARWREKLTTKINFPLTGLDLSEWCHKESPAIRVDGDDSHVYDLIGVVNHYGSMTGGHYIAFCKATACGKDGREEAAYAFNGHGMNLLESDGSGPSTGWRLGRPKAETNFQKEAAQVAARSAVESAEPLWLQFDDELVEPMPPRNVISEMAYVLFYRRRRISPSNIARYSTLE